MRMENTTVALAGAAWHASMSASAKVYYSRCRIWRTIYGSRGSHLSQNERWKMFVWLGGIPFRRKSLLPQSGSGPVG